MTQDIIVVKQLPLIEERLHQIKGEAQEKVDAALALACTAETVKAVKETRAELSKEYKELERRRIDVKNQIMQPYEEFEAIYRECVTDIFKPADEALKTRIDEVEDAIKGEKADTVKAYFDECAAANGIDFLDFYRSGINVTKTASLSALKKQAAAYVGGVARDLDMIDTYPDDVRLEILVEYKKTLQITQAVTEVVRRRKAIESEAAASSDMQEKQQRQAEAVHQVEKALYPPISQPIAEEQPEEQPQTADDGPKYEASFRVTGTLAQIKALKNFLVQGGYQYEQL